ncbi:MAG TPA: hypothetical protein VEU94_13290 [Terriglobales bacterium]|nr:hypothetical protein [Terriglobales bacterium]
MRREIMFFTLAPEVSCAGLVMADPLLDTEEQFRRIWVLTEHGHLEAKPEGKKAA